MAKDKEYKAAVAVGKQKNLFSFFSKQPKKASKPSTTSEAGAAPSTGAGQATAGGSTTNDRKPAAAATKAAPSSAKVRKGNSVAKSKYLSQICVGTKLAVFWPDDNEYYPCLVRKHKSAHVYEIEYEDGESERVDLSTERFRMIGGKRKDDAGDDRKPSARKVSTSKKRKQILEDTDEEMEFEGSSSEEDSGDESGSEYKAKGDDESMEESLNAEAESEEEDNWMDSDSEDEKPKKNKKKAIRKVKVTRVSDGKTISPTPLKPGRKKASTATELDFSQFISQSPKEVDGKTQSATRVGSSAKKSTTLKSDNSVTKKPTQLPGKEAASARSPVAQRAEIPKPVAGMVNPAGTHMHNHLKFFTTNRRDLQRNSAGHPNFSTRTLHIDWTELERVNGKAATAAQKQWWEIKSQYADTVLLFKTGKFYEMFHDDSDVGVAHLGMVYMKGKDGHAGFPEAAYGKYVAMLVERGYRVARVEQTETPDALKERKKRTKGKKPGVVNREVCGVVSKGTRTFCYLDDTSLIEKGGGATTGPLIAIKEVAFDGGDSKGGDEGAANAVCEYGVTIVDAITGVVTLGQFADDVLRSRIQTLVASFNPSEVLYEGGRSGASKTLISFLKSICPPHTVIECINSTECFPKSNALDPKNKKILERGSGSVSPWDANDAVKELHRRAYYPRSSRKAEGEPGISRWPEILRRCVEGGAALALSSFGAALFYLQRSLVDFEILSMGIVKAYCPPSSGAVDESSAENASKQIEKMYTEEARKDEGTDLVDQTDEVDVDFGTSSSSAATAEDQIDHMALDGTTLTNLEILHNLSTGSKDGSLLSKIDFTRSPHGARLLRAWLLRPLFRKEDIDRRADVVQELSSGAAAVAMCEARELLRKTNDIERLLSRVHSMGGSISSDGSANNISYLPEERAVLYESEKHTKRKVGDFSKLLNGLKAASEIPSLFANTEVESPMLAKIVKTTEDGGCFPAQMREKLDYFFDNFDVKKAAKGDFEPSRGMDEVYDRVLEEIDSIKHQLEQFRDEMCSNGELDPPRLARQHWKYINLKEDSKDKYLIELPISVNVPAEFVVKGKRGKGDKQVNKYRAPRVASLVQQLEDALDVKTSRKTEGMRLIFAKFDSMRNHWMASCHATAMLDALGSLAQLAGQPGFSRPLIMDCPINSKPGIEVIQGRHPCVDRTHSGADFIPNDLVLGARFENEDDAFGDDSAPRDEASVLLLSGPNMGGKSTLLRQTCLISIMAQIGSYVPAERCSLTPVDRIFTRLGASDRILCGQSTFFVELAETAAAVRGSTRRSLVIMDELGRGTSTFDGTAIASATVKHLVEKNQCLTLFATHYHSLLEDWKDEPSIRLGHMECVVDDGDSENTNNITFLYTLGEGACPKSFGVNVARLAGLPSDVLQKAKIISEQFEKEMKGESLQHKITPATACDKVKDLWCHLKGSGTIDTAQVKALWQGLQ